MPAVLITGSNTGLGLAFTRQYLADGWDVVATCRNPGAADELNVLRSPRLRVLRMDVTNAAEIAAVRDQLAGAPLDLLINNAAAQGVPAPGCSFGALDADAWLDLLRINTVAPLKVTEAFLPNVRKSTQKLLVFMSSRSGSIGERGTLPHHRPGGNYHYRTSKAALNAAVHSLAFDLKPEGVGVLALHPGWVRTKGGGPNATLDPDDSVTRMRRTITQFTLPNSGAFLDLDGQSIPW